MSETNTRVPSITFDVDQLKQDLRHVIAYSQDLDESKINIDGLVAEWLMAKARYIDAFQGKMSYTTAEPVVFELSQEEQRSRFDQLCDAMYNNNLMASYFLAEMGYECFYNNLTNKDYNYKDIHIPKGTKIIKALKFFWDLDSKELRYWQDRASQVLQSKKISGYLTLSVNPLDFLSSSENAEKWRSCHALDGDYRTGNLSYMLDSSTVMAFLDSGDKKCLPHFPEDLEWNSKRWRNLLFFSNAMAMIFAGRPYPFELKGALDYILSDIIPQVFHLTYTNWLDKEYGALDIGDVHLQTNHPYYLRNNKLVLNSDLIIDHPNSTHYNDLLHSTCYKPYYAYATHPWWGLAGIDTGTDDEKLYIGGEVKCVYCGKEHVYSSSAFLCDSCELQYGNRHDDDFGFCEYCGRHCHSDDLTWLPDDSGLVCMDCYAENVAHCARCGRSGMINSMIYNEEQEQFFCSDYCNKGGQIEWLEVPW